MPAALAAVFGAVIGSFLNVVAYRLPRHQSLARPASRCPRCGTPIKPYDNVPIVGWLLLRGRCRACAEPISARYPLVELATALLAVAVVLTKHSASSIVLGLILVAVLVPVALIDAAHGIIPNAITLPAALAAIAVSAALDPGRMGEALIAAVAAGGFLLAFALAYPRGMGMGDVKLVAVMGLFLGRAVAVALLVGVLSATVVGGLIIARRGVQEGRKTAIPFGPFVALGGAVALLAGDPLVHWYLHHVI